MKEKQYMQVKALAEIRGAKHLLTETLPTLVEFGPQTEQTKFHNMMSYFAMFERKLQADINGIEIECDEDDA